MGERNLELENQGIEQWIKKIKENIEQWIKKIKENFEIVTVILGSIIMGIDYIIKLYLSKDKEKLYGIPSKYFFSFDYNRILHMLIIIIIPILLFLLSIYNKEKSSDSNQIKYEKKIQNFLCHIVISYQLLVFNVYQLRLDNKLFFYYFIYFILLFLFFIFDFGVLVYYNLFKSRNQRLEIEKKIAWVWIAEFIIGIGILINSSINSHNYELTTVEGKKMIVLSEYGDNYLVVPYSEKSKECKKKFCFFVGTYELIEKTGHNLESVNINNDEIEIKKEKFVANPK